MVPMVSSPSSFAIPLIIQKTPIVKQEFPKSKRTIIVKKTKFLYWLSHFPKEKNLFLLIGIHIIKNQQIRLWVSLSMSSLLIILRDVKELVSLFEIVWDCWVPIIMPCVLGHEHKLLSLSRVDAHGLSGNWFWQVGSVAHS